MPNNDLHLTDPEDLTIDNEHFPYRTEGYCKGSNYDGGRKRNEEESIEDLHVLRRFSRFSSGYRTWSSGKGLKRASSAQSEPKEEQNSQG